MEANNPTSQRRQKRLAAGLCGLCGQRPPKRGCTACAPCLTKCRERQQETHSWRREDGRCPLCNRPVNDERWACPPCLVRHADRTRRWARKQLAAGRCRSCGLANNSPEGHTRCKRCQDAVNTHRNAKRAVYRAAGLCRCGGILDRPDRRSCAKCREEACARQRRLNRPEVTSVGSTLSPSGESRGEGGT